MTSLAQWLPVVPIPEPERIPLVWGNVVHHGGRHHPACFGAFTTQGFVTQKQSPGFLPLGGVATLVCIGTFSGVLPDRRFVLFAVPVGICGGQWTTRLPTGFWYSTGHKKTLGGEGNVQYGAFNQQQTQLTELSFLV